MKAIFAFFALLSVPNLSHAECYQQYNDAIKRFAQDQCPRATVTHLVADCGARQISMDDQKVEFSKSFSWTCVNSTGLEWVRVGHLDIAEQGEYAKAGLAYCNVSNTRCFVKGWSTGPTDVIQ